MIDPTDLPGVGDWPAPVTVERLHRMVESAGVTVTPAENQILRARVGDNLVEISVAAGKATVLRVLGLASTTLPKDAESALATYANNWHREKVWPTLLWTTNAEGNLALRSVYTVDFTAGATDQQLTTAVRLGLSATAKGLDSALEALRNGTTEPELG
ncbi:YbjN domain-containing protein [Pseudactinotalea sp. Z1748]|uniref:YbjN domain-containing protein n=1 Tax=Pseudactinotalea sp. Z1748 TaxID=3413027 RepID=UPI003C7DE471